MQNIKPSKSTPRQVTPKPSNGVLGFEEGSMFDGNGELFEARGIFSKHYIEQQRESLIRSIPNETAQEALTRCRQIYERAHKAHLARIAHGGLNESDTESEVIDLILPILGFPFLHRTRQDAGGVPDYILFPDEKTKNEALPLEDRARYRLAKGILEAKSFKKNLGHISKKETPGYSYAKQVRLYLAEAQDARGKTYFEWAILTNGHDWRLYCRRAERDEYFSMNLQRALYKLDDFKLFLALFRREAFIPDLQDRLLLDDLFDESQSRQRALEANLRERVYILVEWIAQGFYENNFNTIREDEIQKVYEASLILLYRLMFILYAEANELLPVHEHRRGSRVEYRRDYSLQRFIPLLIENNYPPEDEPLEKYWKELTSLFEVIDGRNKKVSDRLEIPQYNGGLFDPERHPELAHLGWRLGAWTVQETLKRLMFDIRPSRAKETIPISSEETIDYSTLSVQQLGSIYEGLLEHRPVLNNEGKIEVKAEGEERWLTGSYYTPNWVVDYILLETVKPLLDEIENSETVKKARENGEEDDSFANAVLKLRILDPAMGSGHFLVRATEYLADEIVYHPTTKSVYPKRHGNMSEADAEIAHWRRKVVESCIYGVDKNELAVELAKLSLWLTCISPTYPLSFLDHHLKHGDSLTGKTLSEPTSKYKIDGLDEARRSAAESIINIVSLNSEDYNAVKVKESRYISEVANRLRPFEGLLDHFTRHDFEVKRNDAAFAAKIEALLAKGNPLEREMAEDLGWPLHYELAFPDVFPPNGESNGFDAVIGNPPYVRQETLGELKRYLQRNYASYQGTADLYVYFIERGLSLLRPGGRFGMITSNKWMRAGYGGPIRKLLLQTQLERLIDLGNLQVFHDATSYPMIIIAVNENSHSDPLYAPIQRLPKDEPELTAIVREASFPLGTEGLDVSGFALVNKSLTDIFEKMRAMGKPLGEYIDGKIYSGIKTGYNKAFVISSEQRERLINKDEKSLEIIMPLAIGRDIHKWRVNYMNRYFILTKIGINIEEYPAVFDHLKEHQVALESRWDKGNHWWELRACDYYTEFAKPKIIWPQIAIEPRFSFDSQCLFPNNKCYYFATEDLALLGILNSKAIWLYLKSTCSWLRGGYIELIAAHMKQIPIPTASRKIKNQISELARRQLDNQDKIAESAGLAERRRLESHLKKTETEIDRLVYELYGLTEKEIAVVEGSG